MGLISDLIRDEAINLYLYRWCEKPGYLESLRKTDLFKSGQLKKEGIGAVLLEKHLTKYKVKYPRSDYFRYHKLLNDLVKTMLCFPEQLSRGSLFIDTPFTLTYSSYYVEEFLKYLKYDWSATSDNPYELRVVGVKSLDHTCKLLLQWDVTFELKEKNSSA